MIADVNTSKGLLRINKLKEINTRYHDLGQEYKNKRIFRLLFCQDVFVSAYDKIKSNKGITRRFSGEPYLEDVTLERINQLVEQIKSESWKPRPARKTDISQDLEKIDFLGIQVSEETIVQEVIRMILEAIYEPTFLECSHGFQNGKDCLTAINQISTNFDGASYAIGGDIMQCSNRFNHKILVTLLKRRIEDQRFINLISKLLKAGYFETGPKPKDSFLFPKLSTSKENQLSPMLTNIYLHELDKCVLAWIVNNSKPLKTRRNPKRVALIREIRNFEQKLDCEKDLACRKKLIKSIKQMKRNLSKVSDLKQGLKANYVRYATDWIIGINGPASKAKLFKKQIKNNLVKQLGLNLNDDQLRISDLKSGQKVLFLGYEILLQRRGKIKKMQLPQRLTFYENITDHRIKCCIPNQKIVQGLYKCGYCDVTGFPLAYKRWTVFNDYLIVRAFHEVRSRFLNYYALADDSNLFFRIDYILRYSCAKTLAHRHQSSIRKIFQKHGKTLRVEMRTQKGKSKSVLLPPFKNFKPKLKKVALYDPFETNMKRLTRS